MRNTTQWLTLLVAGVVLAGANVAPAGEKADGDKAQVKGQCKAAKSCPVANSDKKCCTKKASCDAADKAKCGDGSKAACCGAKACDAASAGKTAAVKGNQEKCPVMGGKVNKNLYVDQDGKRVYVCCKGCLAKLEKNFSDYAEKLESDGVVLASARAKCSAKKACGHHAAKAKQKTQ